MRTMEEPRGRRIGVTAGRRWADQLGRGGPAVVFLPGAGALGLDYLLVHERVGVRTTSVIYDRGGTGWSDPVPLPRSASTATEETRAVLRALDVPAPYVLVGHSLGGAHARVLAQRHPDEVVGLVLIDPLHEDWDDHQPEELHLAQAALSGDDLPELPQPMMTAWRAHLTEQLAAFPDDVREPLVDRHLDPDQVRGGLLDGTNVLDVVAELRAGVDPDVPTIVLGSTEVDRGQAQFAPVELLRRQIAGQQQLYAAWCARTAGREFRAVPGSSHSGLPMQQPDAVADAVREVLGRI